MSVPKRGAGKGQWVGYSRKDVSIAIEDAYNFAKEDITGAIELKVEAIYVTGNNPLSEYIVVLVPVT